MPTLFTKQQFEELEKGIASTIEELEKVLMEKGEAGATTIDSWDSSAFQIAFQEETRLRKRLNELKNLAANAKIIRPREQNEKADIGNTVIIEYENGSREKFVLDGYVIIINPAENRISIYSPVGSILKGAKKGQTKMVELGGQKQKIKILEILPP